MRAAFFFAGNWEPSATTTRPRVADQRLTPRQTALRILVCVILVDVIGRLFGDSSSFQVLLRVWTCMNAVLALHSGTRPTARTLTHTSLAAALASIVVYSSCTLGVRDVFVVVAATLLLLFLFGLEDAIVAGACNGLLVLLFDKLNDTCSRDASVARTAAALCGASLAMAVDRAIVALGRGASSR
tara:strand:- start:4522 stop:5076 length:555 start_codon:yes stop_codon:yes gene_type:complete